MGLLNLPNELILSIAEASINREISALTRTNRYLHSLLIDYLYRQGLKSGHAVCNWCCETGMVTSLQRFMRCGLSVKHCPLLEQPLWVAASQGHSTIVRILCENGISLDRDNCFDYDPLVEAVGQRHQAATQVLLGYGMDINYCDRFHFSPLIMAVSNSDWEMCKFLISRGAHLGIPTKNRKSEISVKPCWTALHEAVRTKSRSPDMIELG